MKPGPAMLDALWLTAMRWDDAHLDAVATTLPETWLEAARTRGARLSSLDAGDKAREVQRVVDRLRAPLPTTARLPARAHALLCSEVDRETGRRWAAAAAPPRRGFVAPPALRQWLARLARRQGI